MSSKSKRPPVFFILLRIDMPLTAVASFAHRVSGVLLALAVPSVVHLLQRSLVVALFDHARVRAATVVAVWALPYHAQAGLRHLFYDIDVGVRRRLRQWEWTWQKMYSWCTAWTNAGRQR